MCELWIQSINRSWEWNSFPYMIKTAKPTDGSFNSESKTGMRNAAIFSKVKIPTEC